MMSSNRKDYASASEWLKTLKQDDAWLSQQKQLVTSTDIITCLKDAKRRIGEGEVFEFWGIYGHQIEPALEEVWGIAELSLTKLKIQTIGMLSMEWLEKNRGNVIDLQNEIVEKLLPIFWEDKNEAENFLFRIQGMRAKQITALVKELVAKNKISEMSKGRDLWKVLNDYELYSPSESNWNQQLR